MDAETGGSRFKNGGSGGRRKRQLGRQAIRGLREERAMGGSL